MTKPIYALIKKEWEYNKGRIIPLSIGLALFGFLNVGLLLILPDLIPYIEGLIPEITPEMSIESYMNSLNSIVSIIAVILCADAIAGEREKNTLVLIRTKPIPIYSIIITKLLARYIVVLIGAIVGTLSVYLFTYLLVGPTSIGPVLLSLLAYALILFVFTSIGMLISTIAKSQISAGAISAGVVLVISLVSSFFIYDNLVNFNAFQLQSTVLLFDLTPLTIALNGLALILIAGIIIAVNVVTFYSEKEPTRKKV